MNSKPDSIATWRCPVLFIHGDDDRNVPFQQTTDLVEKLRANGANGIRDIEGKVAREAMSECGQRASFNGADGESSDIHGQTDSFKWDGAHESTLLGV